MVALCKALFVEWERQARAEIEDTRKEALSRRKTLEKTIEARRTRPANANPDQLQSFFADIADLERNLPEVPPLPRLIVDHCTPEAIASLMAEKPTQSLGLLQPEGGIFDTL